MWSEKDLCCFVEEVIKIKLYKLFIENCKQCPSFSLAYVNNLMICLKNGKRIKYTNAEIDKFLQQLFEQCPLKEVDVIDGR